jgi:hypothetical protein
MTGKTDKINDITKLKYNKDAARAIGHIFRLVGENEKMRKELDWAVECIDKASARIAELEAACITLARKKNE